METIKIIFWILVMLTYVLIILGILTLAVIFIPGLLLILSLLGFLKLLEENKPIQGYFQSDEDFLKEYDKYFWKRIGVYIVHIVVVIIYQYITK